MRVLLHTPLKPPDSPLPSGDREMARGIARLLTRLGHRVVMPAESRVAAGVPGPEAHLALERRARAQAARLVSRWHVLPPRHPERFDLWFTGKVLSGEWILEKINPEEAHRSWRLSPVLRLHLPP